MFPKDNLIAYWKLAKDCQDYSGNGNHGFNNDVIFDSLASNGKIKNAAYFDGFRSFIEVPDKNSMHIGSNDFTISAWIKCAANAQFIGDIINKYDSDKRKGINLYVSASAPGYSSVSDSRNLHFGIDNALAGDWIDCGRPAPDNTLISTLIVYKNQLYTGIADAVDPTNACRMYKYVGRQKWQDCGRVGNNLKTSSVHAVIIHKGNLYVSTGTWNYFDYSLQNAGHPTVYRYEDDTTWYDCGLITPGKRILSLASFKGDLYASDDAGYIYKYENENNWICCGKTPEYKMLSMMTYQENLFGGSRTHIHRYIDDTAWDNVATFNPKDICQVHCLNVYMGKLYAGTWENGRIMRYEGDDNWVACGDAGPINDKTLRNGIPACNNEINDLVVYNGKMYAGVIPKGEVWRYDGENNLSLIKRLVNNPKYSPDEHLSWRRVPSMTVFQGKLFFGTSTANGVADANPIDESGKVFSWEAGKNVSYDDDLGTDWKHLTAIRHKEYLKIYVNGKLAAKSLITDPKIYDLTNNKPFLIGFGCLNYFKGYISELYFYNRALNEEEIIGMYNI